MKNAKLYDACFNNDASKAWQRIYQGDNIDGQGSDYMSPLSVTSFFNYHELTRELILMGAQINNKDKEWLTPLHYAALNGSHECIRILLEANADACCRDKLWQTPLHYATAHHNTTSLELIASRCKTLNTTDRIGWSALHTAAYNDSLPAVAFLIEKGISVKLLDKKDRSALHYASLKGHLSIVQHLISKGCLLNLKDRKGFTALHFAAVKGKSDVCEFLLKNGANIDIPTRNGNLPLHFACLHGDVKTIQILSTQTDLAKNYVNNFGQTFLHISCLSNNSLAFINLFASKENVSIADKKGRYPIHYLAFVGNIVGFHIIKKYDLDVNIVDNYGWTPLHIACAQSHVEFVELLLHSGASLEALTKDKRTCLHLAASAECSSLCSYLTLNGCNKYIKDQLDRTALHYAILHKCVNSIGALMDDSLAKEPDSNGRSAIHYAAYVCMTSFVEELVAKGFPINVKDNKLRTPLHMAAFYDGDGIIVNLLLSKNCEISADIEGYYPIHYAVFGQQYRNCKLLLEKGGFSEPPNSLSTLHLALCKEDEDLLSILLDYYKKSSLPLPIDNNGISPIHIAASMGNTKALTLLLEHFSNINIHTPEKTYGHTPIHMAANSSVFECVKLICEYQAFSCDIDCRSKTGLTPLLISLMASDADQIIRYLIKKGADKNAVSTTNHLSPIHLSCMRNYLSTLELLLRSNADLNAKTSLGKTALILASQSGSMPCIKLLVKNNVNLYDFDEKGFGALQWACFKDKPDAAEYLLSVMKKEQIFSGFNKLSSFHCSVKAKSIDCINALLKYFKTVPDLKDKNMRTPLHLAAGQDEQEIAELLTNAGACLYDKDVNGQTPIHIASANPLEAIIDCFMACEDFSITDNKSNTPLHIACLSKNICTALALIEKMKPEEINLQNDDGLTALNIAEENELEDVVDKINKIINVSC